MKARGKGWRACCPAHDDTNPSLDVDQGTDGTVLLCCRSRGCSVVAITHALGLELGDLFPGTFRPERLSNEDRVQATYDYRDEAGTVLFQAVRLWRRRPRTRHSASTGPTARAADMESRRHSPRAVPAARNLSRRGKSRYLDFRGRPNIG